MPYAELVGKLKLNNFVKSVILYQFFSCAKFPGLPEYIYSNFCRRLFPVTGSVFTCK